MLFLMRYASKVRISWYTTPSKVTPMLSGAT